jgi:hypothetical protein
MAKNPLPTGKIILSGEPNGGIYMTLDGVETTIVAEDGTVVGGGFINPMPNGTFLQTIDKDDNVIGVAGYAGEILLMGDFQFGNQLVIGSAEIENDVSASGFNAIGVDGWSQRIQQEDVTDPESPVSIRSFEAQSNFTETQYQYEQAAALPGGYTYKYQTNSLGVEDGDTLMSFMFGGLNSGLSRTDYIKHTYTVTNSTLGIEYGRQTVSAFFGGLNDFFDVVSFGIQDLGNPFRAFNGMTISNQQGIDAVDSTNTGTYDLMRIDENNILYIGDVMEFQGGGNSIKLLGLPRVNATLVSPDTSAVDAYLSYESSPGSEEYLVSSAIGNIPGAGETGYMPGAQITQDGGGGDANQIYLNAGTFNDAQFRKVNLRNTWNIINFDDQTLADDTDAFANLLQGPRPFNPGDVDWVVDDGGVNKIQIPYTGLYLATFIIQFASNNTGSRTFSIYNTSGYGIPLGLTILPANGTDGIITGSQFFAADAGELLQPVLKQNSGGNLAIVPAGCSLMITRIGDFEI